MAAETAVWSVQLKDDTSGAAMSAAKALDQLKGRIQADTKELREMQAALGRLRGATTVNAASVKELTERISAKKSAIAGAQSRFMQLGGSFAETAKGAQAAGGSMSQLLGVAQGMGGPIGRVAASVSSLGGLLGVGLVAGAVAAAAAVAALTVALAAGYAAMVRYAMGAASARREELLRLEGLTKIPNWYGIAAGKATDLQAAIDNVSMASAMGRGDIAKYAEELYRMGLRGKNLSSALDATAIKASTQGPQWASLFMRQAAGAAQLGQSVEKLADRVKTQLGGLAKQQALSFGVQLSKLRENVARIFDGVKIGPFLESLNEVLSLFSQNHEIGRALKTLVNVMFEPLSGFFGGSVAMLAKRFFQGLIITALQFTVVVLTVRNRLRDTFGDSKVLQGVDGLTVALNVGRIAAWGLVGALGLAAVLATTTAIAFAPLAVLIGGIAGAIYMIGTGIMSTFAVLGQLREQLAGLSLEQVGQRLMLTFAAGVLSLLSSVVGAIRSALLSGLKSLGYTGGNALIDGITSGLASAQGKLVSAVVGIGDVINKAFTGKLQMRSPSKLFVSHGVNLGDSATIGLRLTRGRVQRAAEDLAPTPPRLPPMRSPATPSARGGGGRAGSGGRSVTVGEIHVHTAATDARGIVQSIREEVALMFEGLAIEMGTEPDGLEPT